MKLKNILMVAGLVTATVSSASAGDVYITGSSAFRGVLMAYLRSKLTNTRAAFDKPTNAGDLTASVDASSFIVLSGNYNGASTTTTFYLAFTGSVAAVRDVSTTQTINFPVKPAGFDTNSSFLLGTTAGSYGGVGNSYTSDALGNINSNFAAAVPSYGFSDAFQASTTFTSVPVTDIQVAVLPFRWVVSKGGAADGVTNMTNQIARQLFKNGTISLSNFNGVAGDSAFQVYATGRTDDSGTRIAAVAETGVGVFAGLHQYSLSGSTFTDVGNSGYVSGGTLASALDTSTTTKATGYAVSYLSVGDSNTAIAHSNASIVSHNGVTLSSVADVTEGKYTFWCYEHLIGLTAGMTGDVLTTFNDLRAHVGTFTSSTKAIQLGDMHCARTTDGGIVTHND